MTHDNSVIRCEGVCKVYTDAGSEVSILQGVDLVVQPGEMLAIVGASGSGKSTLLQILGGLDQASGGAVYWNGQPCFKMTDSCRTQARNRFLGFVYQFHHLLPEFNVLENVSMPLWVAGESRSSSKERAMTLLKRVGLANRVNHRVAELSGGERQRVAIARALIASPSVVLADEPTGNLDANTAEQVIELMRELNAQMNTAFIIITHNLGLAEKMDRCLCLQGGQLQEQRLSSQ